MDKVVPFEILVIYKSKLKPDFKFIVHLCILSSYYSFQFGVQLEMFMNLSMKNLYFQSLSNSEISDINRSFQHI